MATILRKLPIFQEPSQLLLPGGMAVSVKSNQIVLWVSVTQPGLAEFPADANRFPAVFDTGFNSTFLMGEKHLEEWVGLKSKDLTWIGLLAADGQPIPMRDGDVWIHPNRPHSRDPLQGISPFRLELSEGIGVWPAAIPGSRRLPLLGMRALRQARAHVHLNCRQGWVSMNTRRWFWFFDW